LAATLRALRKCLRNPHQYVTADDDLLCELSRAVVQRYRNGTDKRSRYRPPNPDKRPLGEPRISRPTRAERERMQALSPRKIAARKCFTGLPSVATGCSHGWSAAEPVDAVIPTAHLSRRDSGSVQYFHRPRRRLFKVMILFIPPATIRLKEPPMPNDETLLADATGLPVADRIQLIEALWDTVPEDALPPLSAEWLTEIESRSAEYDAGSVAAVPWEQVRKDALSRLKLFESSFR
jgi:putative addiction module component (TIGR02574 family)